MLGQKSCHAYAREIVVAKRRLATMAGNEYFHFRPSWQQILAIRQMTVEQRGVDANFVVVFRHLFQLPVRETETPVFLVIRGTVRNQIRLLRQGVKVGSQLGQRHRALYRNAVVYDVQIVPAKINDPFAAGVLNVGIANVPFAGHSPVEDPGAAGNFVDVERYFLFQASQRLAEAVAGDAAANRVQLADQSKNFVANSRRIYSRSEFGEIARVVMRLG
jgi:hypothetical protein